MCLNIEAPLALSKVNTTLWFISKKNQKVFFFIAISVTVIKTST